MHWTSWGHYMEAKSGRPFFKYSRIHLSEDGKTTLCGVDIPKDTGYYSLRDDECKRCVKKAAKLGVNKWEI